MLVFEAFIQKGTNLIQNEVYGRNYFGLKVVVNAIKTFSYVFF